MTSGFWFRNLNDSGLTVTLPLTRFLVFAFCFVFMALVSNSYDVVVVGGGSAGCTAAARLSEDPNRKILLLEAGPDPRPIPELVAEADKRVRLLLETPYVNMYPTERKVDGSTFYSLAGRIMGGGSSVNVMSVIRPIKADMDAWVAHGNPEWSWSHVLPILMRIENDQDYGNQADHGGGGPLYFKRPYLFGDPLPKPVQAFLDAALSFGLPKGDLNDPNPFGVCTSPFNIKDGLRQSTVVAYLEPARGRPNLTILDEALVTGLTLAGTRVEGVSYERRGRLETVSSGEVVLTAGAFHSPQILMLSGIGAPAELERHGIEVRHALPGVGENYQDHAMLHMSFEGRDAFDVSWVVPPFRLVTKSDPDRQTGDFHIFMRPPTVLEGAGVRLPISAALLEQRNRGRVSLASADPHDLPIVEAPMLEDPGDVEAMLKTMDFLQQLTQTGDMPRFYGPVSQPSRGEDWARFARSSFDSYHHAAGTCLMGPETNPATVVDQHLNVHGLRNLRVADASIMPTVTHANTNVTCIMIGERVADFMK